MPNVNAMSRIYDVMAALEGAPLHDDRFEFSDVLDTIEHAHADLTPPEIIVGLIKHCLSLRALLGAEHVTPAHEPEVLRRRTKIEPRADPLPPRQAAPAPIAQLPPRRRRRAAAPTPVAQLNLFASNQGRTGDD